MSKAPENTTATILVRGDEAGLGGPEDVLRDQTMSIDTKRAVLARWASDAHAVENAPALRQLDDGTVVNVDEILTALRSLDGGADTGRSLIRRWTAHDRRRRTTMWRLRVARRHRDDDDDPPPAAAAYPIRIRVADAVAA